MLNQMVNHLVKSVQCALSVFDLNVEFLQSLAFKMTEKKRQLMCIQCIVCCQHFCLVNRNDLIIIIFTGIIIFTKTIK